MEKYQPVEMETIIFLTEDVITSSGFNPDPWEGEEG